MQLRINYRELKMDDIKPDMLVHFNRYQKVEKSWYNKNGKWVLIDYPYVEDWDNEKKLSVANAFPEAINNGGYLFGAFDDDKLIAFALVYGEKLGTTGQYRQLEYLHVSNEFRRKGIGKKLFELCVETMNKTDTKKLYISAHSSKESQAFYRGIGCVDAEEINQELFENEPYDVHMEYIL